MEISVIASGSNGNSTLVESKDTSILIDAGKTVKEIEARLNRMGKSLENLNAVLLTHGHVDHYMSVGAISRKYNVPVFMTKKTHTICKHALGKISGKYFKHNQNFMVGNLLIEPVETSHDIPCTGFRIGKFGLFTDTGIVTEQMKKVISKLDGIILESNHDVDMLINGPYPPYLKMRVFSDHGHLSNISASSFINDSGKHLNWTLLGHISEMNNTPELVKKTFETMVKKKLNYSVLTREKESGVWEL